MHLDITNIHHQFTSSSKQTGEGIHLKFNYWWLVIVCILLRLLPSIFSDTSALVDLKITFIILSYILLLFALLSNTHIRGTFIVALGTFFNFLAILVNGGFMPVSPEARYLAGKTLFNLSSGGIVLTGSGGVILPIDQTKLWFFTDIIPISAINIVISIGDIIIGIGILVVCICLVTQIVRKRIHLF